MKYALTEDASLWHGSPFAFVRVRPLVAQSHSLFGTCFAFFLSSFASFYFRTIFFEIHGAGRARAWPVG